MTACDQNRTPRVFVTGFNPAIEPLCSELGHQPGVHLVGASGHIGEGAWAFNGDGIDVVVHAIPGALLRGDLTEIREYTSAPIVLLAGRDGPSLLDDALAADVADVVVLPQTAEQLALAVRKVARAPAISPVAGPVGGRARIITVFSPKGGTGKTVLATNLAVRVAKEHGLRTLLIDLDLQFGDAAIMLGLDPERTLHDIVTAPGELDAGKFNGYLTRHADSGVDVLAAPLRPEDGELVTDHQVERILEVARPAYDLIVVDTSPSFHGPMLSALDRSDTMLLVCTPEVPTLKNVRMGIETLRKLSFPEERLKLVLNRIDFGLSIRKPEVESVLGCPVSFQLPTTPEMANAVNQGVPLTLLQPNVDFARALGNVSAWLGGQGGAQASWSDLYRVEQNGRGGLAHAVRGLAGSWLPSRPQAVRTSA